MNDSPNRNIEHRRTVHGGEDSALSIQLCAWRGYAGHIDQCEPTEAHGFGVYIRNPLAMNVSDFQWTGRGAEFDTAADALRGAWLFADGLADHLGCKVDSTLPRERYGVQPVRDVLKGTLTVAGANAGETRFEPCAPSKAEAWQVTDLFTSELIEDYPDEAAARRCVASLERGGGVPKPEWPKPLPACVAELRALGFDVEGGGAGVPFLSYYAPGAGHVLITGSDGADLPDDDCWMVGCYGPGDPGELDSIWTETSGGASVANRAALLAAAERALAAARLATPEAVEGRLTDELRAYCIAHGLPLMSADELECELSAYLEGAPAGASAAAFAAQPLARLAEARRWLRGFCQRWDAVADTHDRLRREASAEEPCPVNRCPKSRCPDGCAHGEG